MTLPTKISFPVDLNLGIANLSVDDITWNLDDSGATPSSILLDGKQLDGWLGMATGITIDFAGALKGIQLIGGAKSGINLFDSDYNGLVDSFYVDQSIIKIPVVQLGPLRIENVSFELNKFTNLVDFGAGKNLPFAGSIKLSADRNTLDMGDLLQLVSDKFSGEFNLNTGDLVTSLTSLTGTLGSSAAPLLSFSTSNVSSTIKGLATANQDVQIDLGKLSASLNPLAIGNSMPRATIDQLVVESGENINFDSIIVDFPEGYDLSIFGLAELIPLSLKSGKLSFAKKTDQTLDPEQPILSVQAVMNTALLKAKLATILQSPKLDLKVERIDSAGKRQQITAADNLSLTVKRVANQWKTVASDIYAINLSDLVIPLQGESDPEVSASLYLPAIDDKGSALALPQFITEVAKKDGYSIPSGTQVLASIQGTYSNASIFTSTTGIAWLSGSLQQQQNVSTYSFLGQANLSAQLDYGNQFKATGSVQANLALNLNSTINQGKSQEITGLPSIKLDFGGAQLSDILLKFDAFDLCLEYLDWYPKDKNRSQEIGGVKISGLVAQAKGLKIDFKKALNGVSATSGVNQSGADIFLFDIDQNGSVDGFYLDQASINVASIKTDSLTIDNAVISLKGLSNLAALSADKSQSLGGKVQLSADQAALGKSKDLNLIAKDFKADYLLTSGALAASVGSIGGSLSVDSQPLLTINTSTDNTQNRVNLNINPKAGNDEALVSIPSLFATFQALTVSKLSPSVIINNFKIQQDYDLELDDLKLILPKDYLSSALGLAGILPFQVTSGSLTFSKRADGSIDSTQPSVTVAGTIDIAMLEKQLRALVHSADLSVSVSSYDRSGKLTPLTNQTITAKLIQKDSKWILVDSPGFELTIGNLPLRFATGANPVAVTSILTLPAIDAQGKLQSLPDNLISQYQSLSQAASNSNPQVLAQFSGSYKGDSVVKSANGAAWLAGSLDFKDGISTLILDGAASLSSSLDFGSGNSFTGEVGAKFNWTMLASRSTAGEFQLTGKRSVDLDRVSLKDVKLTSDAFDVSLSGFDYQAATSVAIAGKTISGCVGKATGLTLNLRGLFSGVSLSTSSNLVVNNDPASTSDIYLFDQDANGVIDGFYLDAATAKLGSEVSIGLLQVAAPTLSLSKLSNLPEFFSNNKSSFTGSIKLASQSARYGSGKDSLISFNSPSSGPGTQALEATYQFGVDQFDFAANSIGLNLKQLKINAKASAQLISSSNGTSLNINANGSINLDGAGLSELQGDLDISFLNDSLQTVKGTFELSQPVPGLDLKGKLVLDHSFVDGKGSLKLEDATFLGASVKGSLNYGLDSFTGQFDFNNSKSLQLLDGFSLLPESADFTLACTRNPANVASYSSSIKKGIFKLNFGDTETRFQGDISLSSSGGSPLQLDSVQLNLLNDTTINVNGYRLQLIASDPTAPCNIAFDRSNGLLTPSISGKVRFPDLANLTFTLPQNGLTWSNNAWSLNSFKADFGQKPLDLGPIEIGPHATIDYSNKTLTLNPDLSLDLGEMSAALRPLGEKINTYVTPIAAPIVKFLLTDLDLRSNPSISKTIADIEKINIPFYDGRPDVPITKILKTLADYFEGYPGNPYQNDRIQLVELFDKPLSDLYSLLRANPAAAQKLADTIGFTIPQLWLDIAAKVDYKDISLSNSVKSLESLIAFGDTLARSSATDSSIKLDGLSFTLNLDAASASAQAGATTSANLKTEIAKLSGAFDAILAAGAQSPNQPQATSGSLFSVDATMRSDLLDDPFATVGKLLTNKPFDLAALDLKLDAGFSLNQRIPIPWESLLGIPPGIINTSLNLNEGLQFKAGLSVGVTTDRDQLSALTMVPLKEIPANLLPLLAGTSDKGDPLGLYLGQIPNTPLMQLIPTLGVGLSLGAAYVGDLIRLSTTLTGNVSLGLNPSSSRLYLQNIIDKGFSLPGFSASADLDAKLALEAYVPFKGWKGPSWTWPILDNQSIFSTSTADAPKQVKADIAAVIDSDLFLGTKELSDADKQLLNTPIGSGYQLAVGLSIQHPNQNLRSIGFYPVTDTFGSIVDPITGNSLKPSDGNYASVAKSLTSPELTVEFSDNRSSAQADSHFLISKNKILAPFVSVDTAAGAQDYFAYAEANKASSPLVSPNGFYSFGLDLTPSTFDSSFKDLLVTISSIDPQEIPAT